MADLVLRNVEGWTLASAGDDEPLVRDEDLAERLGYERPRDIRKIIERHREAGNLNDSDIRATVAQNNDPLGRGRPGTEFWLTEAAALFIASKSETPAAVAITREMIRVFMAYRRGLLVPAAAPPTLTADDVRAIVRDEQHRLNAWLFELAERAPAPVPRTIASPTPRGGPALRSVVQALRELTHDGRYPMSAKDLVEELRRAPPVRFALLRGHLPYLGAKCGPDGLPNAQSLGRLLAALEGKPADGGWRITSGRARAGIKAWGVVRV